MRGRIWFVGGGLITVALAAALSTYSEPGDLAFSNESPADVTVLTGEDQDVVPASGGTVFLNYGCTPGDITVEFSSGPAVLVPGPVCPDQQVAVKGDGSVELRPASTSNN